MPREIERKYLVSTVPARLSEHPATALEQGYLAVSAHVEVRLRRAAGSLALTVKVGHGEIREEFEVALEAEQFERLWPLTEGARLAKTRHVVPLGDGLTAEVDSYNGQLEGLRVAEVEFRSSEQSRRFEPPPWFGPELTGEERYSNRRLALDGLPDGAPAQGLAADGKGEGTGGAYHLERTESPAEGLRRVARGRARKARRRLARAGRRGDTAEAVHGARKDLKKIRAVIRLVRQDLGEKSYRAENRRCRDAGRLLSESRDAEVKLATLRALRERSGNALPTDRADAWEAALEADRTRIASAGAAAEEPMRRAIAAIAEAEKGIGEWRLEHDSWALIEPGLAKSYSRGRRALEAVRRGGRAEDVHELRKRVKDLWYQLRLLAGAWPEMLEPSAEQAHRLADLLGDHHDLTVLGEDLRSRTALDSVRAAGEELIARRQAELLADAVALGDRLYTEKPKCFRRRMRGYWRSWRDGSGAR